jgi:hypothetical protein
MLRFQRVALAMVHGVACALVVSACGTAPSTPANVPVSQALTPAETTPPPLPASSPSATAATNADPLPSLTEHPVGDATSNDAANHDATSTSSTPASSPAPRAKIQNIGLHIGGGPNDSATKAPFLRAVERRFDEFEQCYGKLGSVAAHGTFGIDLLVKASGGHPEASNPRTGMGEDEFRTCVVRAFEAIEFDPPKHGATKLSYALRFDPG